MQDAENGLGWLGGEISKGLNWVGSEINGAVTGVENFFSGNGSTNNAVALDKPPVPLGSNKDFTSAWPGMNVNFNDTAALGALSKLPPSVLNNWAFNLAASPNQAPSAIYIGSLDSSFQSLMGQSFPGGQPLEDGATIFGNSAGNLVLGNVGGTDRYSGQFSPNLTPPSSDLTMLGTFHTHPYLGGLSATFSGDDLGAQIDYGTNFSVVQSGNTQWLLLRTNATPTTYIEPDQLSQIESQTEQSTASLQKQGLSFTQAQNQSIAKLAASYNMAFYQGSHGLFYRVYPKP